MTIERSNLKIYQVHRDNSLKVTYFLKSEVVSEKILFCFFSYLFLNTRYSAINYFFLSRLEFKYFKPRISKFSNSIFPKKFLLSFRLIFSCMNHLANFENTLHNRTINSRIHYASIIKFAIIRDEKVEKIVDFPSPIPIEFLAVN